MQSAGLRGELGSPETLLPVLGPSCEALLLDKTREGHDLRRD